MAITTFTQQLTTTVGAYGAADVLNGLITIPLGNPARTGKIHQLSITDDDNIKAASTLYLFNAVPTDFADNAAFAPVLADLKKRIGKIAIASADYETLNSNAVLNANDIEFEWLTPLRRLYMYMVVTATPTYLTATALYLKMILETDS